MKIGIIAETKTPPDRRVPFSPNQLAELSTTYPDHEFIVQTSRFRCFSDKEYVNAGMEVRDDVSDCDVLFGVKEVEIDALIPEKTYFFFSHTAKEQPYNRKLLQEIAARKISLVDYEYLTDHLQRDRRPCKIGRPDGVAVHDRPVERRIGDAADHRLGCWCGDRTSGEH